MTKVTLRHLFLLDRMLMSRFGLVIARTVDLLWMPARIAAVSAQIYWATWHQVFRYPRGEV